MLVALAATVLGLVLGVGLAWLALSGLLAVAFRRARTLLRRITQRRQSPRPDSPDRRSEERRAH
jgi:uncharacterized membrane protein YdjX (TVP38/TMEM64 family)